MANDKNLAALRVNRALMNMRQFAAACDALSPEQRAKAIKMLEDGLKNVRRISAEINRSQTRTDKPFKLEEQP